MDKVKVIRYKHEKDWTISKFTFDNVLMGYGVEDEFREVKVHGETRIPEGTYKLDLRNSPKFSSKYFRDDNGILIEASKRTSANLIKIYHTAHELIWVKDVPGFEYILWHWGNSDDDSHGCYIVGSSLGIIEGQEVVLQSRKKYEEIYPLLWRAIKGKGLTVEYTSINFNQILA